MHGKPGKARQGKGNTQGGGANKKNKRRKRDLVGGRRGAGGGGANGTDVRSGACEVVKIKSSNVFRT